MSSISPSLYAFGETEVAWLKVGHNNDGTLQSGSLPATSFTPSFTPLVPVITDGGGKNILWLSNDRTTLLAANGSTLSYSTNEGSSWSNNSFAFPATLKTVRELDNGELLVGVYTAGSAGKLYVSTGWAGNHATANFTLTKTASHIDNYFTDGWSVSISGKYIVANEYGLKGGDTNQARFTYLSQDFGVTWSTIFDLVAQIGNVNGTHLHGACFDPYWNRIWITYGDTQSGKCVYSDDLGVTWKAATVSGQDTNHGQMTTVWALKNAVVFGCDQPPNAIRTFTRSVTTDKTQTAVIYDAYQIDEVDTIRWLSQTMFQARNVTNAPLLIMMQPDAAATIYQPAIILATVDGITFTEIWRDSIGYFDVGAQAAVGPTATGNYLWSNADGRFGNLSLNVAPAPTWYESGKNAKRTGGLNRTSLDRPTSLAYHRGYGGYNIDPMTLTSGMAWTAQRTQAMMVPFRAGDIIQNFISIETAAPGTPANLTAGRMGVWDAFSNRLLAYSADCSVAYQTIGLKTVAVNQVWNGAAYITANAFVIPYDGPFYVGFWFDGTSMPTIMASALGNTAAAAQPTGSANPNPRLSNVVQTAQAAIPPTATWSVAGTALFAGWN